MRIKACSRELMSRTSHT